MESADLLAIVDGLLEARESIERLYGAMMRERLRQHERVVKVLQSEMNTYALLLIVMRGEAGEIGLTDEEVRRRIVELQGQCEAIQRHATAIEQMLSEFGVQTETGDCVSPG